ncbi:FadR/GntR family transcriptional regulator [Sporichthya brevicatena]|uniref:FadR/GntR family transcriptional regulator n=1 Tax=Sporichthya brevicatena TaxID=171442 RepID=A0ABP3R4P0_9ACTN
MARGNTTSEARLNFSEPIVVKSVPDEIQHKILSLLSDRKLLPGDRLPAERELASALRVSRTTLRDALRGLAARGVLESRAGSGWYVQLDASSIDVAIALHFELSDLAVDQILEVRRAFEPAVAYHAATGRTDVELARMRELIEAMEHPDSGDTYLKLADEFHLLVATATHNPFFLMALRPVVDLMSQTRHADPAWEGKASQTEHRELLAALEAQDPERAAAAMATHLGGAITRSWVGR